MAQRLRRPSLATYRYVRVSPSSKAHPRYLVYKKTNRLSAPVKYLGEIEKATPDSWRIKSVGTAKLRWPTNEHFWTREKAGDALLKASLR